MLTIVVEDGLKTHMANRIRYRLEPVKGWSENKGSGRSFGASKLLWTDNPGQSVRGVCRGFNIG
jgi:hypothetical protein